VLRDRRDFYALAMAYFTRAHADNVVHAELFFDPQTHTVRGIPMEVVIGGLRDAQDDAHRRYGITSDLILCFLRHLPEADALATLDAAIPFLSDLTGVGLDSGERGNPPAKFARVFAKARGLGLHAVAPCRRGGARGVHHRGARCPPRRAGSTTASAATRIRPRRAPRARADSADRVPAVEPQAVRGQGSRTPHLAKLLRRGVRGHDHSDDPAYFGGYIGENYRATAAALGLTKAELVTVAENAARASFLPVQAKNRACCRRSAPTQRVPERPRHQVNRT